MADFNKASSRPCFRVLHLHQKDGCSMSVIALHNSDMSKRRIASHFPELNDYRLQLVRACDS